VKGVRGSPHLLRVTLPGGQPEQCEVVASSSRWEALWQFSGYSMTLGTAVEPYPARYIVVSKGGGSLMIFETAARAFWSANRHGVFEAPIAAGDFFRLSKEPAPRYTTDMLMKEKNLRPRRISAMESAFLDGRKHLGAFRVLADYLRSQRT
jgi:hypothetical protein